MAEVEEFYKTNEEYGEKVGYFGTESDEEDDKAVAMHSEGTKLVADKRRNILTPYLKDKLIRWKFEENFSIPDIRRLIEDDEEFEEKPARRTVYNFFQKLDYTMKGKKTIKKSNKNKTPKPASKPKTVIDEYTAKQLFYWRYVQKLRMVDIIKRVAEDDGIVYKPKRRTLYQWFENVCGKTFSDGRITARRTSDYEYREIFNLAAITKYDRVSILDVPSESKSLAKLCIQYRADAVQAKQENKKLIKVLERFKRGFASDIKICQEALAGCTEETQPELGANESTTLFLNTNEYGDNLSNGHAVSQVRVYEHSDVKLDF